MGGPTSNRFGFGLNPSDSNFGLFEALLSLPLFESRLPESKSDQVPVSPSEPASDSVKSNQTSSTKDDQANEDDHPDEVLTSATRELFLASNLIRSTPVPEPETKPTANSLTLAPRPTEDTETLPVADSVAPPMKQFQKSDQVFETNSLKGFDDTLRLGLQKQSEVTSIEEANKKDLVSDTVATARGLADATIQQNIVQASDTTVQVKSGIDVANAKNTKSDLDSDSNSGTSKNTGNLLSIRDDAPHEPSQVTVVPEANQSREVLSFEPESQNDFEKPVEAESNRRSQRLDDARRDYRFQDDSDTPGYFEEQTADSAEDESANPARPEVAATSDASTDPIATTLLEGIESSTPNVSVTDLSGFKTTNVIVSSTPVSGIDTSLSIARTNDRATVSGGAASSIGSSPSVNASSATAGTNQTSSFSTTTTTRTPGDRASGSTGLSKYQEHRILQRALKGIEQAQDGSEPIRVRLHPPELGTLQVTVQVNRSQVIAAIEVESHAARQILMDNLPTLQATLKEQGISIADFRVEVVPSGEFSGAQTGGFFQQQGQSRDGSWSSMTSRYAQIAGNRLVETLPGSPSSASDGSAKWSRRDGNLDVSV